MSVQCAPPSNSSWHVRMGSVLLPPAAVRHDVLQQLWEQELMGVSDLQCGPILHVYVSTSTCMLAEWEPFNLTSFKPKPDFHLKASFSSSISPLPYCVSANSFGKLKWSESELQSVGIAGLKVGFG